MTVDEPMEQTDEERSPGAGRAILARRRRLVWALLAGAVIVTVVGVIAAGSVRSPEQALADLGPPEASALLEPVEKRVLTETMTLRGSVKAAGETAVVISPAGGPEAELTVVTVTPVAAGEDVSAGDVLLELSGRPVILLQGSVPLYRDLQPGDRGDDVGQLQASLESLGYYEGARDGEFGAAMAASVQKMYADRGYDALEVGDPVALREAERAVTSARDAVAASTAGPAEPRGSGAATGGADDAARSKRAAERDLQSAIDRLEDLQRTTGAYLPRAEVVVVPDVTARVDSLGVGVGYTAGSSTPSGEEEEVDATLRLSWGSLTASALASPSQKELLTTGMVVEIADEFGGWSGSGRIAAVAEEPSLVEGETGHVVTLEADGEAFPAELAGAGVGITARSVRTPEAILVVPISALTSGAGGEAVVRREREGESESVAVDIGIEGDGFVEVTPRSADDLREGDMVVVGVAPTSTSAPGFGRTQPGPVT